MKIAGFHNQFRFLSNFWPAEVTVCWFRFPTVEHAYQAMKSPHREAWWRIILTAQTGGQAKRVGRLLTLRANWERLKVPTMRMLLRKKFQDHALRDALLLTDGYHLEETNEWGDTFWGVCNGQGENHLGRLLMQVRDEIK